MSKPQIITTAAGEELVVLSRADYETLVSRLDAIVPDLDGEDAALAAIARAAEARLASGADIVLPRNVADAIINGDNPLRAIRRWRGLSQAELAARSGTDQSMISALEAGRRRGASTVWRAVAAALDVPMEAIMPDALA